MRSIVVDMHSPSPMPQRKKHKQLSIFLSDPLRLDQCSSTTSVSPSLDTAAFQNSYFMCYSDTANLFNVFIRTYILLKGNKYRTYWDETYLLFWCECDPPPVHYPSDSTCTGGIHPSLSDSNHNFYISLSL